MTLLRRSHAFTLIELMVVILIIATFASIIVPAYARYWTGVRLQAKAAEIRDLFAYAREQAVQQDTTATLTFHPQTQVFTLTFDPAPPPSDAPAALSSADASGANRSGQATQLPPREVDMGDAFAIRGFQAGSSSSAPAASAADNTNGQEDGIHFQGDGTTLEHAEFTLVNPSGDSVHMVLWPATGRLTVEEP
ncbi:MAG TPA: prepilin-type N-terminal cleavage/methylation domain-containing protein [Chthonomonadaceae bacterium]|nr:prepilin-type N-terminal cleavage/methylation domain-containing protein [Chthonomonadaceae bacterium]